MALVLSEELIYPLCLITLVLSEELIYPLCNIALVLSEETDLSSVSHGSCIE